MSIFSIIYAFVDVHSVAGAVAGAVAAVSSKKVYAFVTKQKASAVAAADPVIAKLAADVTALKAKVGP